MKFKSRVQMLNYVIGKKPDIMKTVDRRAEKEGLQMIIDYLIINYY